MRINAQVAEGDISKILVGQSVEFTVSTYAEEDLHFQGVVRQVRLLPTTSPLSPAGQGSGRRSGAHLLRDRGGREQ